VTDAQDADRSRRIAAIRAINERRGYKPTDRFKDIKVRITKRGTGDSVPPADERAQPKK
jgi:hypothetical protein